MANTIVMIHGMWGGGWYWENYKRFFESKGYQCITPTLRFHDMDPKELPNPQLGTTSLLEYLEDLEKEINQLDALPIIMGLLEKADASDLQRDSLFDAPVVTSERAEEDFQPIRLRVRPSKI